MILTEEQRLSNLQNNLATIRKVAGWTSDRLGEEIGVTRQTISNLEKNRTPLTKTQYLAIRAVLNQEILAENNSALATVLKTLVDDPVEDISSQNRQSDSISTIESLSLITGVLAGSAISFQTLKKMLSGSKSLVSIIAAIMKSKK